MGNMRILFEKFCFSSKRNIVLQYYETFDVKKEDFVAKKAKNRQNFMRFGSEGVIAVSRLCLL
jgi:hypothetical protein